MQQKVVQHTKLQIFNSPKTAEMKSHNPLKFSIVKQEIKGPSVENKKH